MQPKAARTISDPVDVGAAQAFVATHARLLDRRRLDLLLGGDPAGVLAALDGYRNADGGYGWGLEPDLRSPESQPTAAMHALEALGEVEPATTPRSAQLCDWLQAHTLADGGLPFALPITDEAGCAEWWRNPDTTTSSLQMTAQVAANAHLVARQDDAVRAHPWLPRATAWCFAAIEALDAAPFAYELLFAIRFLDAVAEADPTAIRLLDRVRAFIPPNGVVGVAGGVDGEELRALDFAPRADGAATRLFAPDVLQHEVQRLTEQQQSDGGWSVTFVSASPAATLEWRGYATVQALKRLQSYRNPIMTSRQ